MNHSKKGFTLIEVIVVIAIIGIIAAVSVTSLSGYVDRSREKPYKQEIQAAYRTIQTMFVLEQAAGRDAAALANNPPGKYIDITQSGKLTETGIKKYVQLSGRDPSIADLVFDIPTNSIQSLKISASDGKADMTYNAQSDNKYTVTMR